MNRREIHKYWYGMWASFMVSSKYKRTQVLNTLLLVTLFF